MKAIVAKRTLFAKVGAFKQIAAYIDQPGVAWPSVLAIAVEMHVQDIERDLDPVRQGGNVPEQRAERYRRRIADHTIGDAVE